MNISGKSEESSSTSFCYIIPPYKQMWYEQVRRAFVDRCFVFDNINFQSIIF